MKLVHTFRHLDVSEALKNYTQTQVADISKFLLKQGSGHVYYSKEQHQFCVEISINTKEKYFKASAINLDIYAAVDAVCLKLHRQLLKIRKKNQHHKKQQLSKRAKLDDVNSSLEYRFKLKKAA